MNSTSMAAGQVDTPLSLLTDDQLAAATDDQLAHTVAAILAVQHERALTGGDLGALTEKAFLEGFDHRGEAGRPWIEAGLLFCPGHWKEKSKTSHECTFVSVDGQWVWDTGSHVVDEKREVPGPRRLMQFITVVPVVEGAKVDMVSSKSRSNGPCEMQKATSFQVRAGELVEVSARARKPNGHRS
jgi:hypothetical protein